MWDIQDSIYVSDAAKAEEPVLGKHDIDLGIDERNISRLLRNYMHRCLRRYHGVHGKCGAIGRDHVVQHRTETRKAPWIEGAQREWTARDDLSNCVEAV